MADRIFLRQGDGELQPLKAAAFFSERVHTTTPRAPVASVLHDAGERLEVDGFAILPDRVGDDPLAELTDRVERAVATRDGGEGKRPRTSLRNLLVHLPGLPELLRMSGLAEQIEHLMGRPAFITRGLLFDKVPGANWPMRYHQDLTIAVTERRPAPGFGPWSVKAGVPHVEPPVQVLQGMLALRIHLDRCDENNGPLRVVPGSHRLGRLDPSNIPDIRARLGERVCVLPAGGVMVMRPLLLHASSPAESPAHRRVVHLELATDDLPMGLRWCERVDVARRDRP